MYFGIGGETLSTEKDSLKKMILKELSFEEYKY
jgi:hypothetical protein